uniref:EB domain-containing protein n=1 Tax=Plectus sambesii TaxID=2011161 RepID=A0A914X5N5_9BILA
MTSSFPAWSAFSNDYHYYAHNYNNSHDKNLENSHDNHYHHADNYNHDKNPENSHSCYNNNKYDYDSDYNSSERSQLSHWTSLDQQQLRVGSTRKHRVLCKYALLRQCRLYHGGVHLSHRLRFCRQQCVQSRIISILLPYKSSSGKWTVPKHASCAPYQVMANGQCYNMATVGMQCQVNQQCQGGSACQTGTCQCPSGYTFNGNSCVQQQQPPTMNQPTCSNPTMRAEMNGAVAKSCAQQYCSSGYQCEWNPNYVNNNIRGQYICCGGSTVFNPTPAPTAAPTGRIRMYDATSTPVQCFKTTDCSNVTGYTNCVRSATYNYNVCCSTSACP